MQGINDAWSMLHYQLHHKWIAHLNIMIIKGGNSGRNEIAYNKGDFRDCVCLKPLTGFE